MSRKHYELLAAAIKQSRDDAKGLAAKEDKAA
jgi:hypothetical protein